MSTTNINRRLLNVDAAAAYLSVGKRTMQKLLASGEVLKVRIGSRTLIDQSDLDAYIERIKKSS